MSMSGWWSSLSASSASRSTKSIAAGNEGSSNSRTSALSCSCQSMAPKVSLCGTRKRASFVEDCEGVREPSDRDLVRRARRGDREAAAALFRRYWRDAWRAAFAITRRRSLADDVAADGFERAVAALGRFDERRPFGPRLHRIVANRALDLLRAERRLSDEELPDTPDLAPAHGTGDRGLLASVIELSLERRVVVVLRYGVGMTPKQIAAALDLPVGTVNSRLARALDQLRESLEGGHGQGAPA